MPYHLKQKCKVMTYDEMVSHLTYDHIYCEDEDTPHKCALLYAKPLDYDFDGNIECGGTCNRNVLIPSNGFFHCKECQWDLCLECMAEFHPEIKSKKCQRGKFRSLCPLNCRLR